MYVCVWRCINCFHEFSAHFIFIFAVKIFMIFWFFLISLSVFNEYKNQLIFVWDCNPFYHSIITFSEIFYFSLTAFPSFPLLSRTEAHLCLWLCISPCTDKCLKCICTHFLYMNELRWHIMPCVLEAPHTLLTSLGLNILPWFRNAHTKEFKSNKKSISMQSIYILNFPVCASVLSFFADFPFNGFLVWYVCCSVNVQRFPRLQNYVQIALDLTFVVYFSLFLLYSTRLVWFCNIL